LVSARFAHDLRLEPWREQVPPEVQLGRDQGVVVARVLAGPAQVESHPCHRPAAGALETRLGWDGRIRGIDLPVECE
jgi:hypothetical protein